MYTYIYDMVPYKLQIYIYILVCLHYMFDVCLVSFRAGGAERKLTREGLLPDLLEQLGPAFFKRHRWTNFDRIFRPQIGSGKVRALTAIQHVSSRMAQRILASNLLGHPDFFANGEFLGHNLRKDMLCLLGE